MWVPNESIKGVMVIHWIFLSLKSKQINVFLLTPISFLIKCWNCRSRWSYCVKLKSRIKKFCQKINCISNKMDPFAFDHASLQNFSRPTDYPKLCLVAEVLTSLEALLEIPCNFRLCQKLAMPLTWMYFLLLDNALNSMDSKEDFPSMLTWVGFVYATLELLLSDDPLFPLLLLPEFDLCRLEGMHNPSLQSFKNYLS